MSGQEGPSSSALFQHSFPQPSDLDVEEDEQPKDGGEAARTTSPPALEIPRGSAQKADVVPPGEEEEFVDAPSEPEDEGDLRVFTHQEEDPAPVKSSKTQVSSTKSFVTASSVPTAPNDDSPTTSPQKSEEEQAQDSPQASDLQVPSGPSGSGQKALGKRPVSTVDDNTFGPGSADADSTSSLLRKADVIKAPAEADVDIKPPSRGIMARVKRHSENRLTRFESPAAGLPQELQRKKSNLRNLVKFDIPEDSKRARVHMKAKQAQMTITRAPTKLRRQKIQDGVVVKMERMLVRVDAAGEVPADFDENVNQRVTSRVKDKWREYMIVCRHSHRDEADFVLQLYKTRVETTIIHAHRFDTNALVGHPRDRTTRSRQKGCLRDPSQSQD